MSTLHEIVSAIVEGRGNEMLYQLYNDPDTDVCFESVEEGLVQLQLEVLNALEQVRGDHAPTH